MKNSLTYAKDKRPMAAGFHNTKDEGGRMKDEGKAS
jgi:hypothetical protein